MGGLINLDKNTIKNLNCIIDVFDYVYDIYTKNNYKINTSIPKLIAGNSKDYNSFISSVFYNLLTDFNKNIEISYKEIFTSSYSFLMFLLDFDKNLLLEHINNPSTFFSAYGDNPEGYEHITTLISQLEDVLFEDDKYSEAVNILSELSDIFYQENIKVFFISSDSIDANIDFFINHTAFNSLFPFIFHSKLETSHDRPIYNFPTENNTWIKSKYKNHFFLAFEENDGDDYCIDDFLNIDMNEVHDKILICLDYICCYYTYFMEV